MSNLPNVFSVSLEGYHIADYYQLADAKHLALVLAHGNPDNTRIEIYNLSSDDYSCYYVDASVYPDRLSSFCPVEVDV